MAAERWWHSVAIGLLHLILFGFAFGIGFVLEVFVSRYYQGSHLAAFSPCIAASAFLMGLLVNRTRKDRTPLLFGIAGVLWLAFAIWDEGRWWEYSWSHESKTQYLIHMFFGTAQQCSGSECIGEMLFTTPCAAAIAYSIGAAVGLMIPACLRPRKQTQSTP
jgi:predicted anti-sigma-YlaC factor YlaD